MGDSFIVYNNTVYIIGNTGIILSLVFYFRSKNRIPVSRITIISPMEI